MSSTTVHSNKSVAGANVIPTERNVEIPPKNAKKGPSTMQVAIEEGIDIPVQDGQLNEKGELKSADGKTTIVIMQKDVYERLLRKQQKRTKSQDDKDREN